MRLAGGGVTSVGISEHAQSIRVKLANSTVFLGTDGVPLPVEGRECFPVVLNLGFGLSGDFALGDQSLTGGLDLLPEEVGLPRLVVEALDVSPGEEKCQDA